MSSLLNEDQQRRLAKYRAEGAKTPNEINDFKQLEAKESRVAGQPQPVEPKSEGTGLSGEAQPNVDQAQEPETPVEPVDVETTEPTVDATEPVQETAENVEAQAETQEENDVQNEDRDVETEQKNAEAEETAPESEAQAEPEAEAQTPAPEEPVQQG